MSKEFERKVLKQMGQIHKEVLDISRNIEIIAARHLQEKYSKKQ